MVLIQHHGLTPVAKDKLRPRRGLIIPVPQGFYICSPLSGRYILSHGRQRLSDKPRKRDKCRHQMVAAAFRLRNTLKINKLCPAPRRLKPAATKTWFAGQPRQPVDMEQQIVSQSPRRGRHIMDHLFWEIRIEP